MAKKTDKAIKDLAKEVKKLRKENEKLGKTLEKAREDQAESHQKILDTIEERLTAWSASTDATTEAEEEDGKVEEAPETATDRDEIVEEDPGPEVTDAAERRAKELGVDPTDVKGTGSGGRVLVKDVEAAAS